MPKFKDQIEAEWQFDVDDLGRVEQWIRDLPASIPIAITMTEPEEHIDTYFDTADWRIHRSGYALRLRRTQNHAELTLKSLDPHEDGFAHRREITQQLPSGELDSIDQVVGPVGERVAAIRGRKKTGPLFTWITRRSRFRLWREGQDAGELALDHATVIGDSFEDQTRLLRVEVEVPVDRIQRVRPFVDAMVTACRLQPATASKFTTGARVLGLVFPSTVDVGPVEVDRNSTILDLAFSVLRRQYREMLRHEFGTRLGDDIEELHDMRVAARRLRAALSFFRQYLDPEFESIRAELRWVAAALGAVRDLDVQLEELQRWKDSLDERDAAALDALDLELQRRRTIAREQMLEVLDSDRYDELMVRFGDVLRAGPAESESEPALAVAPKLVERRIRKFRRMADRLNDASPDAEFHALRIEGKKLRYALEFVSPLYGKSLQQFIRDLVTVQDLLGRHQDSVVAIEHLREISIEGSTNLPAPAIFAIGRIAERYAGAAGESLRQFPEAYSRVSGKRRERLERILERGLPGTGRRPRGREGKHGPRSDAGAQESDS